MPDKTEMEAAFDAGAATKLIEAEYGGVNHVLVPTNCDLKSLERLMPAPNRLVAHPVFDDLDGFADYAKEFTETGSRIFVNESLHNFETVFDHHSKGKPAWGDHSAKFQLRFSREWKRFRDQDGTNMSPIEFAEFIEDNMAYISAKNMTAADLLTMAQTFKIKVKGEVEVNETLAGGSKKLIIIDDNVLKGVDKKGMEIKFPEKFTVKMRVFKNCDTYPIEVFLRNRTRSDSLSFFFKIPDPSGLEEAAFDKVIDQVKAKTKLPTLKGSFNKLN